MSLEGCTGVRESVQESGSLYRKSQGGCLGGVSEAVQESVRLYRKSQVGCTGVVREDVQDESGRVYITGAVREGVQYRSSHEGCTGGVRKTATEDFREAVQKYVREGFMHVVQEKVLAPGTLTILSPVSFSLPLPGKTKLISLPPFIVHLPSFPPPPSLPPPY